MKALRILAVSACLLLSGCFLSATELITVETADRPIQSAVPFTHTFLCDQPAKERPMMCGGETGTFTPWRGTLKVVDGWYVFEYDDHEQQANTKVLLKNIGGNYYIAQADLYHDAKPPALKMLKDRRFGYDLVRVEGNTAYGYSFSCEKDNDRRWLADNSLSAIDKQDCIAGNLDGLKKIFLDRLARGAKPKVRYDFKP